MVYKIVPALRSGHGILYGRIIKNVNKPLETDGQLAKHQHIITAREGNMIQ